MKRDFWIILALIAGFLGYMLGYSVPPFIEVGFSGDHGGGDQQVEQQLLQQYQQLYESDEE